MQPDYLDLKICSLELKNIEIDQEKYRKSPLTLIWVGLLGVRFEVGGGGTPTQIRVNKNILKSRDLEKTKN